MSNRTPLLRMIVLVVFLIIILVIASTHLSNRSQYNINDPIFKKTVILRDQDRAYSVLLHTLLLNGSFISGYSDKYDSLISFQTLLEEIEPLKNKLDDLPNGYQKCNTCHYENKIYIGDFR